MARAATRSACPALSSPSTCELRSPALTAPPSVFASSLATAAARRRSVRAVILVNGGSLGCPTVWTPLPVCFAIAAFSPLKMEPIVLVPPPIRNPLYCAIICKIIIEDFKAPILASARNPPMPEASSARVWHRRDAPLCCYAPAPPAQTVLDSPPLRSEEHTSEL